MTIIDNWVCIEVEPNVNGSFERGGRWYFARYNIEEHKVFLAYCSELESEDY